MCVLNNPGILSESVGITNKPQSTTAEDYVTTCGWRDAKLEHCPDHEHGGCRLARHGTYCRKTPAGFRVARYYCPDAHRTYSQSTTAEDYVTTCGWRDAKLEPVPHEHGGCRLARHGTYCRKTPAGFRVARYYCPDAHRTYSLAGVPASVIEGADRARPGRHVDSHAARRWSVRWVNWVQLILTIAIAIRPDLFANIPVSVTAFRQHTGSETVLVDLRLVASRHLQAMPNPVGSGVD